MPKLNKIEPLSDFIFLKFKKEKETPGGIVLSDVSKDKPAVAEVIAVGPGRLDKHGNLKKVSLKSGDKIVLDPFLPREVSVGDEKYLVLRETEIFAKVK